ncbi:hypothetical protein GQ457_01G036120 [Hibiscus cannabinus]
MDVLFYLKHLSYETSQQIIIVVITLFLAYFKFRISPLLAGNRFILASRATKSSIRSCSGNYAVGNRDTVKMVGLIKRITFNVSSSLLFRLQENKEKDDLFEDFLLAIKGLWTVPLKFPGTTYRKALQARGRISRLLSKLIKERKEEMAEGRKGSLDQNDVISSLLMLRDENGDSLMEEEIIDNLISVMIASHDTTSALVCHFIRHLARDKETLNRVLQEQEEVAKAIEGKDVKLITWSEIQMMKYTWTVGQELLRLNPPVFGNFKCAQRDTTFDGFDIPKGWKVFWFTAATHMDDNIFKDPEVFDPGRFEESSKLLPPYTYIPFGAGPRICPGGEYARIEALLLIHHLIMNYQWTELVSLYHVIQCPIPPWGFHLSFTKGMVIMFRMQCLLKCYNLSCFK